ncbi:MAG: hypothetical protein EXR71_07385 [Myxococcales bacterium]|nr:hypothetical protein [Myxococcales bacterium]
MNLLSLVSVLMLGGCAPAGTGSRLAFAVDDDVEVFVDEDADGIEVTCSGDDEEVDIDMSRGLFQEQEGPMFRVSLTFTAPDEGASQLVTGMLAIGATYHSSPWPIEVGTVTVTDWVALDRVARVSVELAGVGAADGGNLLDGTITCVN